MDDVRVKKKREAETKAGGAQDESNAESSSKKAAQEKYQTLLINKLNGTAELRRGDIHVLFLDERYASSSLPRLVEAIEANMPPTVDYSKIYLKPKIDK